MKKMKIIQNKALALGLKVVVGPGEELGGSVKINGESLQILASQNQQILCKQSSHQFLVSSISLSLSLSLFNL